MAAKGKTSERIEGDTPNGGVASIAYFRDAQGDPCSKKDAVTIEIHELDKNDVVINRAYLEAERGIEEPPELTDEDEAILDGIWDKLE